MTEIEQRIETDVAQVDYPTKLFTDEDVAQGTHRSVRGGQWDTLGRLQVDFLSSMGLRPEHKYLDIGCGEFHSGSHLIDFLQPGNYYGIDANPSLIRAGYDTELTAVQRDRLPVANLHVTNRFDADFGVQFHMALAQSLFTHVSLNHIRLCLHRVAKSMAPGGKLYATYIEQPAYRALDAIIDRNLGAPCLTERNVYWYYRADLRWAAQFGPWTYRYIGQWGHHTEQHMVEFTRKSDSPEDQTPVPHAPPSKGQLPPKVAALVTRARRGVARRLDPG